MEGINNKFSGLRKNINPSVTEQDAVEMLVQHIITQPVFKALFEDYSFVKNNTVSLCLQGIIDALNEQTKKDDVQKWNAFIFPFFRRYSMFPLYWYEKKEKAQKNLFENSDDEYTRHDGISDFILEQAHTRYGNRVTKEEIFYYVYGILHSPDYRR